MNGFAGRAGTQSLRATLIAARFKVSELSLDIGLMLYHSTRSGTQPLKQRSSELDIIAAIAHFLDQLLLVLNDNSRLGHVPLGERHQL